MSLHNIEDHPNHRAVSNAVYSCMETGNFSEARILLDEYEALHPAQCAALRLALARDYGQGLK